MLVSVSLIVLALCLYSLAIWADKLQGQLKTWMIITFSAAFVADLCGTSLMGLLSDSQELSLHSYCGFLALVVMCLHLLWALLAKYRQGRSSELFRRFSLWAWLLWLVAFFSGIPK